ncbi:MAG: NFACT RNA binding domain-containing protein, partial [Bacillota bacterium]|nr:NFACT RNA binding domain-containing protein [Bacillota bacterium]
MAYDGIFFRSLCKELREALTERKIEKINQHSDRIISLSFARLKGVRLQINIGSEAPLIAFSEDRLPNPEQAPMFCMLLRKHLGNGIIKDVRQLHSDRIILFECLVLNEMKDYETKFLIVEIMGRHSNLILCDADYNVLDSLKHVNPLMSKRPMGPGYRYAVPFEEKRRLEDSDEAGLQALLASDTKLGALLVREFAGFSPQIAERVLFASRLAKDRAARDLSAEELTRLHQSLNAFKEELGGESRPHLYKDKAGKLEISNVRLDHLLALGWEELPVDREKDFVYSSLVFDYFQKKGKNDVLMQKISSLVALIKQSIEKEEKRIKNLEKDMRNAEDYEKYKIYGELCTANMHLIKKGMHKVSLYNYYENREIEVPLKFDKSPGENAEAFFKRYQKMKKTLLYADEQIQLAQEKIEHLDSVLGSLEQCEDAEDFDAIRAELEAEQIVKEKVQSGKKKKAEKKLPPREFTSPNGFLVKVGRNNLQNDELTLKSASKQHIWLHTKIIPSSHVILCAKMEEARDEDILFAASVCASYSKARQSENV